MDQEFKDYFESRFGVIESRFDDVDRRFDEVDRRFGDVDRRFGDVDRRFADMESQLAEVKDEVHQTRILVEKLDDKIDLVAEGVQSNTEVMHRHREENRQELREFRSVMEASHRHLVGRVSAHDDELEQLDNRVTFLEARKA